MAHQVAADFCQNVIRSRIGRNIPKSAVRSKCYKFELKSGESFSPDLVPLSLVRIVTVPSLYGPATDLETRRIMYPCSRFRCWIPCPCLICSKQHPTCRTPTSQGCSCEDCYKHFYNHIKYHGSYHFGCKSCFQLVKYIPNINYIFLDVQKKLFNSGGYDNDNSMRPRYWLPPGQKINRWIWDNWPYYLRRWERNIDDNGKWCRLCNLLHWSFDDLRNHLHSKHM